jgi:hypothetical protein
MKATRRLSNIEDLTRNSLVDPADGPLRVIVVGDTIIDVVVRQQSAERPQGSSIAAEVSDITLELGGTAFHISVGARSGGATDVIAVSMSGIGSHGGRGLNPDALILGQFEAHDVEVLYASGGAKRPHPMDVLIYDHTGNRTALANDRVRRLPNLARPLHILEESDNKCLVFMSGYLMHDPTVWSDCWNLLKVASRLDHDTWVDILPHRIFRFMDLRTLSTVLDGVGWLSIGARTVSGYANQEAISEDTVTRVLSMNRNLLISNESSVSLIRHEGLAARTILNFAPDMRDVPGGRDRALTSWLVRYLRSGSSEGSSA